MSTAVRNVLSGTPLLDGMIGHSREMLKLYRMVSKLALRRHPVLIHGESGSGKETLARSIHSNGPAPDGPFVALDCASLSSGLLESELAGASAGKGDKGETVFLDDIADLPRELQAKLASALQKNELRPVGTASLPAIAIKVIAATSRDLESAVAKGTFRRDLYFRLNVIALRLPPLRERKEDIPALVKHFLERISRIKGAQYSVSPRAMDLLLAWQWPGNVRELEVCLHNAASSSKQNLDAADLPSEIRNGGIGEISSDGVPIVPLAEVEKQSILNALRQLNGDKIMTARMLGIGKTTLYRKLKEYGISPGVVMDTLRSRRPVPNK